MNPIPNSMITSEHNFRNRRKFISSGIAAAIVLPLAGHVLAGTDTSEPLKLTPFKPMNVLLS